VNALLVLRPDASSRFGGDAALARGMAKALSGLGVSAHVVESAQPDARGYDVAHVFGVFEPDIAAGQIKACRAGGAAIALSPIWLDLTEVQGVAREFERVLRRARTRARAIRALERLRATDPERQLPRRERVARSRRTRLQADLLRAADALIPNGAIEARECAVKLGAHDVPFVIARIPPARAAFAWAAARDGVLCVGRIETRKNQALLALALREDPIDLECVGEPYDERYAALCERWAGRRTRFPGRLDDEAVKRRFERAAVHALVSWGETAGMASLEAALAGAQLVVGDRGAELEYFGVDAEYADPSDPDSIRAAIFRALQRPARAPDDALDRRVRRLTWRLAAERTLRAYGVALERHAKANASLQPSPKQ